MMAGSKRTRSSSTGRAKNPRMEGTKAKADLTDSHLATPQHESKQKTKMMKRNGQSKNNQGNHNQN